jgi:hypothetical protein
MLDISMMEMLLTSEAALRHNFEVSLTLTVIFQIKEVQDAERILRWQRLNTVFRPYSSWLATLLQ